MRPFCFVSVQVAFKLKLVALAAPPFHGLGPRVDHRAHVSQVRRLVLKVQLVREGRRLLVDPRLLDHEALGLGDETEDPREARDVRSEVRADLGVPSSSWMARARARGDAGASRALGEALASSHD